jgi:hypothetical protein
MFDGPVGIAVAERGEMAKKKQSRTPSTASSQEKKPWKKKQNTIIVYKGPEEVSVWLRALAESVGLPMTNTLDLALREFAEKRKFRPMPKRQAR